MHTLKLILKYVTIHIGILNNVFISKYYQIIFVT